MIKLGVSLYSYQEEFLTGDMNLEECIEAVSDMDADGIEILPEQMIPGFPNLTDEFLDKWFGWMERYHTTPVCIDAFLDTNLYYGRTISQEEIVDTYKTYIDYAAKLHTPIIRSVLLLGTNLLNRSGVTEDNFRKIVAYAEDKGIKLGTEIHPPMTVHCEPVEQLCNFIEKIGTKNLGFIPDAAIYTVDISPVYLEREIRDGMPKNIMDYIVKARKMGMNPDQVNKNIYEITGEKKYCIALPYCAFLVNDDPEHLRDIIPYVFHVHGKTNYVDENYVDVGTNYEGFIKVLSDCGYNGYISTEYEGNRHIHDAYPACSVEQVRRHHVMLRRLMKKYEK